MGWPDPIEIWNKFASHSGARIVPEYIREAKVITEPPELRDFDFSVINKLRIITQIYPGSSVSSTHIFTMSFKVPYAALVDSPRPSPTRSGAEIRAGHISDIEVGQFLFRSDTFSSTGTMQVVYKDNNWYPLASLSPIAYEPYAMSHFDYSAVPAELLPDTKIEDWMPPTNEEVETIIPAGSGRALRTELERINAEREMRQNSAIRPKCSPALDADNRILCPCRSAPSRLWCKSSEFYNNNPAVVNTLFSRLTSGVGVILIDNGMDGFLSWTCGYSDLPVRFDKVAFEGETFTGRLNIHEFNSGLSIEIASGRGESLQTACDMYRSYYTTTLDMLFIGDAIKDIQREVGSLDRMSAYERVPFKQCPNRRHMIHEDRLMCLKILGALECNTPSEDIILAEAWSIKFNGMCTVCATKKFTVPPEDLPF